MKKIIIVQHLFGNKTAKTQRMLAAAKVYKKEGFNVVFVISTETKEVLPENEYRFVLIEERPHNKLMCFIQFYKAIKSVYDNESVILFDGVPLYSFIFKKSKYNVFSEITEIPFFGQKPTISMRILESIRSFSLRRFTGIMVISSALKDFYLSKGYSNIEVINMFVDTNRFDNLQKSSKTEYIGYCGKISIFKDGVNDLIKSFAIFSKSFPRYSLHLMGAFESVEIEKELKQLVNELGIKDKVIFTGMIESDEMPQRLLDATVLALARPKNRQAQFGFPTKLGEYLATGNPVVVTKVGDIPNFLQDGVNAYLAEPDNPTSFADALCRCASDKSKAYIVGNNGKKLVSSEFSHISQSAKALNFMIRNSTF